MSEGKDDATAEDLKPSETSQLILEDSGAVTNEESPSQVMEAKDKPDASVVMEDKPPSFQADEVETSSTEQKQSPKPPGGRKSVSGIQTGVYFFAKHQRLDLRNNLNMSVNLQTDGSRPGSARSKAGRTPGPDSQAGSQVGSRPTSGTERKIKREEDKLNEIEVIGRDDNTRPAVLPEPSPDEVRFTCHSDRLKLLSNYYQL